MGKYLELRWQVVFSYFSVETLIYRLGVSFTMTKGEGTPFLGFDHQNLSLA